MEEQKVITIRFPDDLWKFIEETRGDMNRGVFIKKILSWLQPYGPKYVQDFLQSNQSADNG